MKLFKTVDEKLADIGFIKCRENKYGATYKRTNVAYKYEQVVDLMHKASGKHIIQSYDKDLFDVDCIGNTCVGLTMYETKLFYKKMKQLGWKPKKE
jgi:hypothetical protein